MKTIALIILFFLITISSCKNEDIPKIDCANLQKDFQTYLKKSRLPFDNPDSICYDFNLGTDVSKVEPKWAVAKVTKMDPIAHRVEFEGEKDEDIPFPYDPIYKVGQYYKVDIINKCRTILIWVSSSLPSPIEKTIVKPQRVDCK